MNKTKKALVVFSGGLDSMLAVKILQEQNIEVTALSFESNFYNADTAKKTSKQLGINLKVVNISDKILELTKNPPNGLGKNMNPCIDCHGMMFRIAGLEMRKDNFDILATGEVLGQRPFSQNKDALGRVQVLAGVDVLRPLSAKLMNKTSYEKDGLVDRSKLGEIQGRTRDLQTKMVKQYGIKEFPSPAGGCLLTDPGFSKRLSKMFTKWPECDTADIELLKNGRVFWFENLEGKHILAVVGRNKRNNDNLEKLAQIGDIMLQLKDMNGPLTLIRGLCWQSLKDIEVDIPEKNNLTNEEVRSSEQIIKQLAIITGFYAVKARGKKMVISIISV